MLMGMAIHITHTLILTLTPTTGECTAVIGEVAGVAMAGVTMVVAATTAVAATMVVDSEVAQSAAVVVDFMAAVAVADTAN
jgi:hypothetical protein